jgi:lipopolysaccharide/colanic/teichoic acid biosynthesis glycosyltransferase
MVSSRDKGLPQILTVCQVFGIMIFYSLGAVVVIMNGPEDNDFGQAYFKYALVVIVALIVESTLRPPNLRPSVSRSKHQAVPISVRQVVFMVFASTLLMVYSRDSYISRIFLAYFGVISYLILFFSNRYAIGWLNKMGVKHIPHWRPRTMLLGPSKWCDSVLPHFSLQKSSINITKIERIEDQEIHGSKYLDMLVDADIDLLVLPPRPCKGVSAIDFIRLGDRMGFRCWLPVEISILHGRDFDLRRVGGIDVVTPPAEPMESSFNQLLKRIFDFCVCIPVVLFVLPPLCLMVWLIHKRYSPGPLFFRQARVGQNGSTFQVFKFRTLNVVNENEAKQVTKDDNRIFPLGGLLRRLSLDEIPQFLNVILGEMSVVGPRPHMEVHDIQFREIFERYGVRRYVKPGVTGLAQVKGFRGEIVRPLDLRHRAKLDNFYVGNWSVTLDAKIVFLTFFTMFFPPKTAY